MVDARELVEHHLYFVGTDNTYGKELWKSDGTVNGTAMVKDINQWKRNIRFGGDPQNGQRAIKD